MSPLPFILAHWRALGLLCIGTIILAQCVRIDRLDVALRQERAALAQAKALTAGLQAARAKEADAAKASLSALESQCAKRVADGISRGRAIAQIVAKPTTPGECFDITHSDLTAVVR